MSPEYLDLVDTCICYILVQSFLDASPNHTSDIQVKIADLEKG